MPTPLRAAAALSVAIGCAVPAFGRQERVAAGSCEPFLASAPALHEQSLAVRGGSNVESPVSLPAQTALLVMARERGIDATLMLMESGREVARADNPVTRSGIQRLAFIARPGHAYAVRLNGKQHPDAMGQVDVRIVDPRPLQDLCREVQTLMALGDVDYAAGQRITRGSGAADSTRRLEAYRSAASRYQAAAGRLDARSPAALTAHVSHTLAAVNYEDIQDYARAQAWAQHASRAYARTDDAYGLARAQALEAAALMEVGISHRSSSGAAATPQITRESLARARAMLASLAALHAQRGEAFDQAQALNNIGLAHYYEGHNGEAIDFYQQALPLYERIGERPLQAQVLTNIAVAEYELGRLPGAIERYRRALSLLDPGLDPRLYAINLQNSALANWAAGNFDLALRQYGEGLELWRRIQDVRGEARCLHGIGSVYETIGSQDLALDFYRQALALRSALVDSRGRTASLRAIGNILREQGKAGDALLMHQEALTLASNTSTRAGVMVQIARDYAVLGQREQALTQLEGVLGAEALDNDFMVGRALLERGKHRSQGGELERASEDLKRAVRIFRDYEAIADEFAAWVSIARLELQRADARSAMAALDRALQLAEEVRTQSANPELRASLLQPLRPAFDMKISLLAARQSSSSDVMNALLTAERSRARALADYQSLDADASPATTRWMQERRAIYRDLAARRFQLESLLDRSGPHDARVQTLRAAIAAQRHQLNLIDTRIGEAAVRESSQPARTERIDLDRVPVDTAIVEYWLGADQTFAWIVTRERVVMERLGASGPITRAALEFHAALSTFSSVPQGERLRLAERLHSLVLQPIEIHLSGKDRLVFAPDGALHYVPFGALRSRPAGRPSFLVQTHDVAVAPSVRMLLGDIARPRAKPSRDLLLVADPVYERTDVRLSAGRVALDAKTQPASHPALLRAALNPADLVRLPGTAREAATIGALLPAGSFDLLEGFDATRERFLGAGLERYRFIHVASHAVADSEVPQLSALILSTFDRDARAVDGRVLAADFMQTRLNADVVVLSACETALGKNVAGEGLVGLQYAILARGARAVASSLWQVPDEAAARLMAQTYASVLRDHAPLDRALSRAMRSMLTGPFADPAFWGAFVATIN